MRKIYKLDNILIIDAMLFMKCLDVLFCNVEPLLGVVLSLTNFCISRNKHVACRWRDWMPISKVQLSVDWTLSCMPSCLHLFFCPLNSTYLCLFRWHWQLSTFSLHP